VSKSKVAFERWTSRESTTWPFQVLRDYALEFHRLFNANLYANKYAFSQLKLTGATWSDEVKKHFTSMPEEISSLYVDLKDWSLRLEEFSNWSNLNAVIVYSSHLETYMAAVVTLALESDPGLIFGSSRILDGTVLLKNNSPKADFKRQVEDCTKGDWQSRLKAYESIFGTAPAIMTSRLGELENLRNLRNKAGHAFGRDIEEARQHGVKDLPPIEKLSPAATRRFQGLIWKVAKAVDEHLLTNHIGEYQVIRFYHNLYPSLDKAVHPSERAIVLKKQIGKFKAQSAGKKFCKELVTYYENL